jgi:hypothetical protein
MMRVGSLCESGLRYQISLIRSEPMAKPNFQFQKRQKELEKKKKNEEKLQRKLAKNTLQPEENPDHSPTEEETHE